MAQWGKAAETAGARTTPETMQQIIAGDYSNSGASPVIGGYTVTGRADLAFDVAAGTGVCATAAGAVKVASSATTTSLITPPASGTQNWLVYSDSDGHVLVGIEGSVPTPYLTIARYPVPAGCKATSSLTNTWNTNYALAYGSRLPRLAYWQENAGGGMAAATEMVATAPFYVPTDRTVQISIRQELYSKPTNSSDLGSGSVLWQISLDGGAQTGKVELPVDRRRIVQPFDWVIVVQKGSHSIVVNRSNLWPGGDFGVYHFGQQDGYVPGSYSVYDLGVAE